MVQKAVELGVLARLQPGTTRHTQASRVNLERMRANAIEAAEQCGILTCRGCRAIRCHRAKALEMGSDGRVLIFSEDEDAEVRDPVAALSVVNEGTPLAVLIGPEGGFAEDERATLLRQPNTAACARSAHPARDTAAVAALECGSDRTR